MGGPPSFYLDLSLSLSIGDEKARTEQNSAPTKGTISIAFQYVCNCAWTILLVITTIHCHKTGTICTSPKA